MYKEEFYNKHPVLYIIIAIIVVILVIHLIFFLIFFGISTLMVLLGGTVWVTASFKSNRNVLHNSKRLLNGKLLTNMAENSWKSTPTYSIYKRIKNTIG